MSANPTIVTTTPPRPRSWPHVVLPIVITIAALWSLTPLPIWLLGTAPKEYTGAWALWIPGAAITVGVTFVALILTRRRVTESLVSAWRRHPGAWPRSRFIAIVAVAFAALALSFTLFVSHGNPRNVDGFAELFQARIFLAGRLWLQPPRELAHFGTLHMILGPERWFSQFPPGQPFVLAIGLALGAWWLLNPFFALALVASTYRVALWSTGETVARLATVLLCLSPFAIAIAGTEMNHLPAATLGVTAAASATFLTHPRRQFAALLSGLLLGVMTAFRPLDAVAAAFPVAFIAVRTSRSRISTFALIFVGGVVGSIPTLWFNAQTTGHWLEFGYTYLWGPNHSLGFHDVPFGVPLTPLRAVGLAGMDLHLLNRYLLDLPIPVVPIVALGYIIGRGQLRTKDALPLLGIVALMGLLFFYWHRDILYGPRFLYSAMPWIAITMARSIHLLRRPSAEAHTRSARDFALTAIVVAVVVGVVSLTPTRVAAYRDSTPTFNYHPDTDASEAGIHHATVVIPDGWGSRLVARMWAAGIPVRSTTHLYSSIDACTLQEQLDWANQNRDAHDNLQETLDSLAALNRPGIPSGYTEDPNLRLPTWEPVAPKCVEEMDFDRAGFLAFAPYLYLNNATLDGDIVWARDMRDGNADLKRRYPDRRLYRYRVTSGEPSFTEITTTSTEAAFLRE